MNSDWWRPSWPRCSSSGRHPVADPIASIVVATIIAYNGIGLLRNNASFLLGRAPGREYLAELEEAVLSVPGVVGVSDIRAEYVGPNEVLSGMHVQVPPDLVLVEAIRIADEVRQRVGKISDAGSAWSRSTRRCLPRRKEAIEGPSSPAERSDGLLAP
jgi:divalent metal cation (Fe/Co/Zn/Cd) transporter